MSVANRFRCPLSRHLRTSGASIQAPVATRCFSQTCTPYDVVDTSASTTTAGTPPPPMDPGTLSQSQSNEGDTTAGTGSQRLQGSLRSRSARRSSLNMPFEQLPYQCFQEARKVLTADREEKLKRIATERLRIRNLEATPVEKVSGGAKSKATRLASMHLHLNNLKIQADINDPCIKKAFEDGHGDMTKPVYRHLAEQKWRAYDRLVTMQRCSQHHIVPDVLPTFDARVEVKMAFQTHNVQPGQHVLARISSVPPRLRIQSFEPSPRLLTFVAIDPDVPDLESDGFKSHCHYLACNIPINPVTTSFPFSKVPAQSCVLPWTPPVAQKGSPNHRIAIIALQQPSMEPIDLQGLLHEGGRWPVKREEFSLRQIMSRLKLEPVGLALFRSKWDETTKAVMLKHGIEGADIEYKFKRIEAIKPKQRPRGWEATHTGPKYRSLGRGGDWQSYN